jgi:alpha-D-ribose 1-methylphosphonate 5-triphosphate synthase subunit PhnG
MITLNFTQQELAVLNDALMQMPYGRVAPLVQNINKQIQAAQQQQQPSQEPE